MKCSYLVIWSLTEASLRAIVARGGGGPTRAPICQRAANFQNNGPFVEIVSDPAVNLFRSGSAKIYLAF